MLTLFPTVLSAAPDRKKNLRQIAFPSSRRLLRGARRTGQVAALIPGLCCLGGLSPAHAQQRGQVTSYLNKVETSAGSSRSFTQTRLNQTVSAGDAIRTGARSKLQIRFTDNSVLRINEMSEVELRAGAAYPEIYVAKGAVFGVFHDDVLLRCEYGTIKARNAQVEVQIMANRAVVRVFSGSATVSSNAPAAASVTVEKGSETILPGTPGSSPSPPHATPPLVFAGGDEFAWMYQGFTGHQQTYRYGSIYDQFRMDYFELDDAHEGTQYFGRYAVGIQPIPVANLAAQIGGNPNGGAPGGVNSGNLNTNIGVSSGTSAPGTVSNGGLGVTVGANTGGVPPINGGNLIVTIGNGPQPSISRAVNIYPQVPVAGGVGYASTRLESLFGYARASTIVDNVFIRIGGRFGTIGDQHENNIEELSFRYRTEKLGEFQGGRFHWWPGPIGNGNIGRLYSFTTADGLLWSLPGDTDRVQVGWLNRINPLFGPVVSGYVGRFSAPMQSGRIGFSLLSTSQGTLGSSADFAIPLALNKLEMYGEAGRDTSHQGMYALGFYFPELLQRFHTDLTVEYGYRGYFGNSFDVGLHFPAGRNVRGLITLSKPGPRSWEPGIGLEGRF